MKRVASAGTTASATNKLESRVVVMVFGKIDIYSPIMPETRSMGRKAATVVMVPEMIAHLKFQTERMAASNIDFLCWDIYSFIPSIFRAEKVIKKAMGIDNAVIIAPFKLRISISIKAISTIV